MTPALWVIVALAGALALWWSTRMAWWRFPLSWARPRVLMYHMIREPISGARFNKLRVSPADFDRQVGWLKRKGFAFVFASELFDDRSLQSRAVCITFDDGYADNLLAADPILARHGARATLYLVEERSNGWSSKKKAHHADGELADEPKLTDDQVRDLLTTGRWELGGHTRSHAMLTALSRDEAFEEIRSARVTFQREFGAPPLTFAYPFGEFTDEHVTIVREAGYLGAVTTDASVPARPNRDPFRTPRVKVSGKDGLLAFRLRLRNGKRGLRR